MSKLKDEMIGAEGAVGDVADEALRLTCCEIDNIFQKVFTTAFVGNVQKILDEQDHPDKNNVLLNSACNEFLVTRTGNLYEIKYDEEVTVKQANFLDDKEKMADFKIQTKEDFLRSYSYLTEQEYDNTNARIQTRGKS